MFQRPLVRLFASFSSALALAEQLPLRYRQKVWNPCPRSRTHCQQRIQVRFHTLNQMTLSLRTSQQPQ